MSQLCLTSLLLMPRLVDSRENNRLLHPWWRRRILAFWWNSSRKSQSHLPWPTKWWRVLAFHAAPATFSWSCVVSFAWQLDTWTLAWRETETTISGWTQFKLTMIKWIWPLSIYLIPRELPAYQFNQKRLVLSCSSTNSKMTSASLATLIAQRMLTFSISRPLSKLKPSRTTSWANLSGKISASLSKMSPVSAIPVLILLVATLDQSTPSLEMMISTPWHRLISRPKQEQLWRVLFGKVKKANLIKISL